MTKIQTAGQLRKAIAALSAKKQGRRYPAELRSAVTSFARRRIAAGDSLAAVCSALDVGEPTLARFLDAAASPEPVGFGAVTLRPEPAPGSGSSAPTRGLRVSGPCGLFIEGLTVEELATLVRSLAC